MRHNDYKIIGACPACFKPVFRPVAWTGRQKPGNDATHAPHYSTCIHPVARDVRKLVSSEKARWL